ncbi:MAG: hypothetical protein HY574_02470 [candidate division NC10 bacterium]|nr:hypothetical protein [candidate division NC10 bacterium]
MGTILLSIVDLALQLVLIVLRVIKIAARPRSSIGKAIQAAHRQKESVQGLTLEIIKLHQTGQLSEGAYARAKDAYEKWAKAQATIAHSLMTWRNLVNEASTR